MEASPGASALTWLGSDRAAYEAAYDVRTNDTPEGWAGLIAACDVLNNTTLDQLASQVGQGLDVEESLWYLAVENAFVDEDGYLFKGADYYLYWEVETGLLHPIQHDGNEVLGSAARLGPTSWTPTQGDTDASRPLISRPLAVPAFRESYLSHMRTLANEALDLTVAEMTSDCKRRRASGTTGACSRGWRRRRRWGRGPRGTPGPPRGVLLRGCVPAGGPGRRRHRSGDPGDESPVPEVPHRVAGGVRLPGPHRRRRRPGDRVELDPLPNRPIGRLLTPVTQAVEPQRLLEYRWGKHVLPCELISEGDGCRLIFSESFTDGSIAARNAAGWLCCLAGLESGGREPAGFDMAEWRPPFEKYAAEWEALAGLQQGPPGTHPAVRTEKAASDADRRGG
jgi:hypothetical protein